MLMQCFSTLDARIYHSMMTNECDAPNWNDLERSFFATLPRAQEISIRLIEHRHPQNFMQGIFSIVLTSKGGTPESQDESLILTKYGVRNPTSSWPVFVFHLDDSQFAFLWNRLIPALKSALNLKALTLQGCARVPGFYTRLLQTISTASLTTLTLASWVDFCSFLRGTQLGLPPSSSSSTPPLSMAPLLHLQHLSLAYYLWDETSAEDLRQMLTNQSRTIHTLHLETGTMPRKFWNTMMEGLQHASLLHTLSWIGKLDLTPNTEEINANDDETESEITEMREMCGRLRSNHNLTTLELTWNIMPPSSVEALIASFQHTNISKFSLSAIDEHCAVHIGAFLATDTTVTTSNMDLAQNCVNACPLLEGVMRNSALINVSLSNMALNNEAAKAVSMLLVHNKSLEYLSLAFTSVETGYLEDILLGLRFNTSLLSFRLSSPTCLLTLRCCSALCDALSTNSTLLQLHMGECQVPACDECTFAIAQGIMANSTLQSLCGLASVQEEPPTKTIICRNIMVNALEHNTTLIRLSFMNFDLKMELQSSSTQASSNTMALTPYWNVHWEGRQLLYQHSSRDVDYYLKLNRMGRKQILTPNALRLALIPHLLAKKSWSVDQMYYLLRARVDWFQPSKVANRMN